MLGYVLYSDPQCVPLCVLDARRIWFLGWNKVGVEKLTRHVEENSLARQTGLGQINVTR